MQRIHFHLIALLTALTMTPAAISQQLVGTPSAEVHPSSNEQIVVVYTVENVKKGRKITDEMLQEVPLPIAKVDTSALRCRKQAIGRKAKCDIAAGSLLMSSNCDATPSPATHLNCSQATMVFAGRDLAEGEQIRSDDVVVRSISPFELPSRVPNRANLVIGMKTNQSVKRGDPLIPAVLKRTSDFKEDKRNQILF